MADTKEQATISTLDVLQPFYMLMSDILTYKTTAGISLKFNLQVSVQIWPPFPGL